MGNDCNDCLQSVLVQKLDKRVAILEETSLQREKDMSTIKTDVAVNKKQTDILLETLSEIKDSVRNISEKIDALEKVPGDNWQQMIKTIITVVVSMAATYFLTKK